MSDEATHLEPLDDPQCDSAQLLTAVQVGAQELTVSETTNGQWFCVGDETLGLDSSPQWVEAPALTDSGSLTNGRLYYLFVLPADTPTVSSLRDETGNAVPMAQAIDGDHLLILDIDADPQRFGVDEVDRRWDLIGPSGDIVLSLTARGPAAGSAPTTFDDVIACLAENDIDIGSPQPLDPAVTRATWSACEGLNTEAMVASGMASAEMDRNTKFVRCMADQGWLQVILDVATIDVIAHGVAAERCKSQ